MQVAMNWLDRIKRHRKGWPRGVRPMFPELERIKAQHPAIWEEVKDKSAGEGLAILKQRGISDSAGG